MFLRSSSSMNVASLVRRSSARLLSPIGHQSYVSRAHPRTTPEYPVGQALEMVLEGVEERKVKRQARWERNAPRRQAKGLKDDGPYRNQDETIDMSINLNLDPRRPGQALRGSLLLPHGTGKSVSCIVFSKDETTIEAAKAAGHLAGGENLADQIKDGTITLDSYQRALATKDMMPTVQKQLARLLGPRGLMPNPKTNTVFEDGEGLLENLKEQSSTITYRTESNGILHFSIGKASFTPDQLLENMQAICATVQDVKPENYGKGKKKKKMGKNVKYWLRAHLSATQGKGVRMDIKTVDPTSPFFMKEPE